MSHSPPTSSGSAELLRKCQILILCEDFAAYQRAADVCWRILLQLADDLDFSFDCWNFYELADPASNQSAMRSAKASDVILLSMRQPKLSPGTEEWLDSLTSQRLGNEGVLALVLNEPSCSTDAVARLSARLEQSARKMDMDFLSTFPAEEVETRLSPPTFPAHLWPPSPITQGRFGERNFDHWGLNE